MPYSTLTLTPRYNVKEHQIIDVEKVIKITVDSHKPLTCHNKKHERPEEVNPMNISVYDHDVFIDDELCVIIHMLTKG